MGKECTLREAVELCKKNGGRFRSKSEAIGMIFYINNHGEIKNAGGRDNSKLNFILHPTDFDLTWIYEPPEQSAFQKWNSSGMNYHENRIEYQERKKGWNAAITKTLDILINEDINNVLEKVTKLKEE